ncbi:enoyl-CoA hydratase-related protein [Mycobacterium sp. AZCC_0083]|uniref:enoyl-CoA hydratase-related protein n=1 Tax=Mycobacterium sp. AZCC_0083 TaxID=2735882 RepID=UPI0016186521|nr:enoyl-CoA hydratase-related protein [Mycobacterium sp. AZCC_0083]MBB5165493.1 enoyl-CoA hydratase/carnithine racemase [Mycobacterium sp. AZCC_0083]
MTIIGDPVESAVRLDRQGHVATITIDRPKVRNALDLASAMQLMAAVDEIENDPETWVGIVTGAGSVAFSAGADLGARQRGEPRAVIEPFGFGGFVRKQRSKPFIAAVNGYAFGGGFEIALSCEIVVAAPNAKFSLPEVKRGLIAGGDCLPFAARALPPALAADLALTGRQITADEAVRLGLVNAVGPDVLALAHEYAARICEGAPLAGAATLALLRTLTSPPPAGYYALADAIQARLQATEDAAEGALAFKERRPPQWTGR